MVPTNIILIGFMGTGKTAVGGALAKRLGRRLVETDDWIVNRAGKPIPRIFEEEGEERFRDLETEAARAVSEERGLVVSTGGGIVGRDENLRLLRQEGVLVCLTARPDVILRRTQPWTGRPMLLTAQNPEEAVEHLLRERAPRYALTDCTIDTSDLSVEEVVDEICRRLPSLLETASTRS